MIAGSRRSRRERAIDGQVVNDLPPKDRDIAMVFQNYALYPHMNAAKNMGFALKMRGVRRTRSTARARGGRILGLETRCRRSRARSPAASASASRWGARSSAAAGVPDGRAALEPRREAARARCAPRSRGSSATSA
jgi:ABC-type sugar transport system ATPase subunit